MKKLLFFSFAVLLLSSCKPVMKKLYGITDPKVESKASITKFARKKGLSTSNIYAYQFQPFMQNIKGGSVPEVFIFSKDKKFIPYGDETACNASAFDFIKLLDKNKTYPTTTKKDWTTITTGLTDLDGNAVTNVEDANTDYYVFIYWTKYTGRLNKDHVREWEADANNNTNANIKVLKVNMDFQEWWGEDITNKLKK